MQNNLMFAILPYNFGDLDFGSGAWSLMTEKFQQSSKL